MKDETNEEYIEIKTPEEYFEVWKEANKVIREFWEITKHADAALADIYSDVAKLGKRKSVETEVEMNLQVLSGLGRAFQALDFHDQICKSMRDEGLSTDDFCKEMMALTQARREEFDKWLKEKEPVFNPVLLKFWKRLRKNSWGFPESSAGDLMRNWEIAKPEGKVTA